MNKYIATGETIRAKYNKDFVVRELNDCDALFSNIEGQSLDKQQRLAVIKNEDNNLVIAGAGIGKTTTVAGKVAYVIDRFKISYRLSCYVNYFMMRFYV
jgi:DNA helicase-4